MEEEVAEVEARGGDVEKRFSVWISGRMGEVVGDSKGGNSPPKGNSNVSC
jgi:hypothetical protein